MGGSCALCGYPRTMGSPAKGRASNDPSPASLRVGDSGLPQPSSQAWAGTPGEASGRGAWSSLHRPGKERQRDTPLSFLPQDRVFGAPGLGAETRATWGLLGADPGKSWPRVACSTNLLLLE